MKATELRIGNLIYDVNNKIIEIEEVLRSKISYSFKLGIGFIGYKSLKPIPLTEEWLLKFGFEIDESNDNKKTKTLSTQVSNTESLYFDENEWYISHDWNNNNFKNTFWNQPKYVHQLQNLYFALTGEELTIK